MKITSSIIRPQRFTQVKDTVGGRTYTFRSKFEWQWAQYKQFLKDSKEIEDWLYESTAFTFPDYINKPHIYTPDFTVITKDGRHYEELKGRLTTKDLSKYPRLAKHYPDVILDIVMQSIPSYRSKGFSLYAKLKQLEGGAVRRIIDGGQILRQMGKLIK